MILTDQAKGPSQITAISLRKPTIGVVAYELEGARTGVGRYLEGLLSGIQECNPGWHWRLFFKGEPFDHPLWSEPKGPFETVFDQRPHAHPVLWEQLRLSSLLRDTKKHGQTLDLLFSPAYSLPPTKVCPSMVTMHDLSFLHHGENFPWRERWRRRFLARRAVGQARRVLADTRDVAEELQQTYSLGANQVGVVPLGLDPRFFAVGPDYDSAHRQTLDQLGIRPPYLLHLGSMLDRRHLDLVIAAFGVVAQQHPALKLVLAGENRLRHRQNLQTWIDASGVAGRIQQIGYVPESALVSLYRGALLSFYLSSYEGYGLPPLESLAAGTAPIVASGLALDELWPEYPYRCPRLDRQSVVETTWIALADRAQKRKVTEEGVQRMGRLTWKKAAYVFLEQIQQALTA